MQYGLLRLIINLIGLFHWHLWLVSRFGVLEVTISLIPASTWRGKGARTRLNMGLLQQSVTRKLRFWLLVLARGGL